MQGSFDLSDDQGEADLTIPLHGPLGSGVLRFEAWKDSDGWIFGRLEVELDESGRVIDLVGEPSLDLEIEAETTI